MPSILRLKVLWRKNLLGFAAEQILPNHTQNLTSYYFWPRTKTWEQIKSEFDTKLWLQEKEKTHLLNRVSDIINFWQQHRMNTDPEQIKSRFPDTSFDIILPR